MRVIAGRLGGRTLRAPKGSATRPTSDRVREALFQILGDLDGARVADLYAGTGALGIEALSRGAKSVCFVESNRAALAALRANIEELGLGAVCGVIASPLERALAAVTAAGPFDLILCDPPWADLPRALRALSKLGGVLSDGGRLVLEHSARDEPAFDESVHLPRADRRTWGDTAVSIFQRQAQGMA